jgi:hypothetical protein
MLEDRLLVGGVETVFIIGRRDFHWADGFDLSGVKGTVQPGDIRVFQPGYELQEQARGMVGFTS